MSPYGGTSKFRVISTVRPRLAIAPVRILVRRPQVVRIPAHPPFHRRIQRRPHRQRPILRVFWRFLRLLRHHDKPRNYFTFAHQVEMPRLQLNRRHYIHPIHNAHAQIRIPISLEHIQIHIPGDPGQPATARILPKAPLPPPTWQKRRLRSVCCNPQIERRGPTHIHIYRDWIPPPGPRVDHHPVACRLQYLRHHPGVLQRPPVRGCISREHRSLDVEHDRQPWLEHRRQQIEESRGLRRSTDILVNDVIHRRFQPDALRAVEIVLQQRIAVVPTCAR